MESSRSTREEASCLLPPVPHRQRSYFGDSDEVLVPGEDAQPVADAESRQQRVDGPHLDPFPTAPVPKTRRLHMVPAFGNEKREGVEAVENGV